MIDELLASARSAFGEELRSVVLYGSAAEGRMRVTSDVNLLFVLRRFEEAAADAFREPFRFARAAGNVSAMFVLDSELAVAGEAFAQKFADIAQRHTVLYGDDLLSALPIPRQALLARTRQVLLNLTMRLRELYVERSLREEQCALTVAEMAAPLRTSAAAILELEGKGRLAPKEALETLTRDVGRPDLQELLAFFSDARETRTLPAGRAASILFRTYELARALHDRAHGIAS